MLESQRRRAERDCRDGVTEYRIAVCLPDEASEAVRLMWITRLGPGNLLMWKGRGSCLVAHASGWTLTLFPSAPAARRAKLRVPFHDTVIAYVL